MTSPVWWNSAHTYKNAVTNELFLYTSAARYNRWHDQAHLDNAKKVSLASHFVIMAD